MGNLYSRLEFVLYMGNLYSRWRICARDLVERLLGNKIGKVEGNCDGKVG